MKFVSRKIATVCLFVGLMFPLTGCVVPGGDNQSIPGITGPNVELSNGYVRAYIVFNALSVDGGVRIPFPKYPNSSLEFGPDFESAGALLAVNIAVEDFLKDKGTFFPPNTLPGGRPLPSVGSGKLPAVAIQVPQLGNTVFYIGAEVMGFFIPFAGLDFLQGGMITGRFHNTKREPIGILSLVGSDAQKKNSGFLVLMRADLMGIFKKPSAAQLAKLDAMF